MERKDRAVLNGREAQKECIGHGKIAVEGQSGCEERVDEEADQGLHEEAAARHLAVMLEAKGRASVGEKGGPQAYTPGRVHEAREKLGAERR